MSTWEEKLIDAFGPGGYHISMRRSLLTAILFEAHRCVGDALPDLKPFQRRIAYWDMVVALVDSLSFLQQYQKDEVLWRTGTSKEQLQPEGTWKRRKLVLKELTKINEAVSALLEGRSDEEAVEEYIQQQYVS